LETDHDASQRITTHHNASQRITTASRSVTIRHGTSRCRRRPTLLP
jgi:hypothetical protein